MKEATGELNMTLVTVIAISAIAAVFTIFVWPAVKNNIKQNTYCASAYSCVTSTCENAQEGSGATMACKYTDDEGDVQSVDCPCQD